MKNATQFIASLFVVSAFLVIHISAQSSSVDTSFSPVPSARLSSLDLLGKGILAQQDGKLVIWGGNLAVDGYAKGHVARLNVDGTVDNSFNYCGCLLAVISNVAIQSDGKLLVAGYSANQARIVRLNTDGSQDNSFVSVFIGNNAPFSSAEIIMIQPDGKILADLTQSLNNGFHAGYLLRLNPDGSTDGGFTWIAYDGGRLVHGDLVALALDQAGRMYISFASISGGGSTYFLKRYNANGTLDNTWSPPNFTPSLGTSYNGLAVQPDGSLLITGRFDTVNGVPKRDVVRVLPAGNVDLDFSPPTLGTSAGQLAILQNGKILVGYSAAGPGRVARLKTNGSLDGTFMLSPSVSVVSSKFALDPSERILFLGISNQTTILYFRLNPNGDLDSSFNPDVTVFGRLRSLALQTDGKILMAGTFNQVNGVRRESIARVNANGTLDTSFNAAAGFDVPPLHLVIQTDGKIIASGDFESFDGTSRPSLVRIMGDGTMDAAFAPSIQNGFVETASLQADGKILIAGNFTTVNGVGRTGVARLNSDGTLDNSFNPIFGNPFLTEIFQQADGKIIVGGSFSGVNGFNRSGMVRLIGTDGSLDQTFNAGTLGSVQRVWPQPDGKYVITGNGVIRRRNSDGTADSSFVSPVFGPTAMTELSIDTVLVQPDGTFIVGGRFDTVAGLVRKNLVRLTSTGGVDQLFFPVGADGAVRASLRQPDGKLVVGGEFSRIDNVLRSGVARLNVVPYRVATPFDFDGDGRADISVFRSSTNRWYELFSSNGTVGEETFGLAGDILAPADFDGDGITDEAIFRPSNGQWWYKSSLNGSQVLNQPLGIPGDIPRPSDFDGDDKADFVVFRPSSNTWSRFGSSVGQVPDAVFGSAGDQPLVGDFDGDGKSDLAVFRPSTGDWWYAASSAGGQFRATHWGQNGDIPVPADYDGDGKTDHAIFRPSDGGWYIYNSGSGSFTILAFGTNGDRPVAADYDGDGRADIAVFRPSTGIWYLLQSTSGFAGYQFGITTDTALPGSLIP